MIYKEKLRELLKEVPEIKKDLEELRFGTKIQYEYKGTTAEYICIEDLSNKVLKYIEEIVILVDNKGTISKINYQDGFYNIIGNPLEERHLRMYCEKNNKQDLLILNDGHIYDIVQGEVNDFIIKLDNTKNFNNQSEEVYEKIFNYLTK